MNEHPDHHSGQSTEPPRPVSVYTRLPHAQLSAETQAAVKQHLDTSRPEGPYEQADHRALTLHLMDVGRPASPEQVQEMFREYVATEYQPFRIPDLSDVQQELGVLTELGAVHRDVLTGSQDA